MEGAFSGSIWAAWLGILTSISPCPLATNIAAVSFIGNNGTPRRIASCGLAYAAGRMAAYLALAVVLVAGILSSTGLSNFLLRYMNRILGPILILTGMVLLELMSWNPAGSGVGEGIHRRAEKGGITGALILGAAFALSFCPVSAALFFGSLIPLSLKHRSTVVFPLLFGAGTALPVLLVGGLLAFGASSIEKVYDRLRRAEWWGRRVTGTVFVLVGIYYTLRYVYGVI